jgi:hypothetical protein
MPRDFVETFIRVGWEGIEWECHAHKTTITRWIRAHDAEAEMAGTLLLREKRRAWLEQQYAEKHGGRRVGGKRPRARRYVLGMTLSAVNVGKVEG